MCRPLNTGASYALAPVSGFGARMAAMLGQMWRGTPSPLAAASGRAESMNPNWKPDGENVTRDLRGRIYSRFLNDCNRDRAEAKARTDAHMRLAKAVYSEAKDA